MNTHDISRGLNDKSAYLTAREAAAYLNVSINTLRRWNREKHGPQPGQIAGRMYYRVTDLDAYIAEQFTHTH